MSSTFIEHSPEADGDKSLILIMDGEGNVTADPAHFEKLINNQKLPDMGIKIVRLDSGQCEDENNADADSKQELKLTVEEIYPENLALAPGDQAVMSSPLEILPGPSNEHISHDIVDPFSQMDSEQLQRLEHALASEQAKQILGENVAAILDMLSVDDSPAAFLQNSIKNDHCYTNLLPSSDPNGPSFFMNDNRAETSRGKGKAKIGTPVKGRKIISSSAMGSSGTIVKKIIREGPLVSKQQTKQSTLLDYGIPVGASQTAKSEEKAEDPSLEEDIDVEESEGSRGEEEEEEDEEDDNLSDEDYSNRSTRTKRKPRKNRKRIVMKRQTGAKGFGRAVVGKPVGRFGRRTAVMPEIRARNEKLNDAMSKIVQSMEIDGKEIENKDFAKKGMRKIKTFKPKPKEETISESEKPTKEAGKPPEEPPSPVKSQSAKYPKRENRKPPAHLADAFGPALFSAPDIIRRVSTGEEVPQTPPEKKNFTVGAHSKLADRSGLAKPGLKKGEAPAGGDQKGKAPKSPSKEPTTMKAAAAAKPNGEHGKTGEESREEKPAPKSEGSVSERASKTGNVEIQKLIEQQQQQQQVRSVMFEEDQDYSDENIDEIYLDPTQMDQSLLEGFSQAASKSEDQLLQEAILLQEQLIESNKGIVIPEALEENQVQIPFETETIENIQNEITSAILVAQQQQQQQQEPKQNFQYISGSEESHGKKLNKVGGEGQSEEDGLDGGNLVVDESKEDRRRNSAKRRRSDEVSDLDSDMDDALSEASWNSEDDPDRLWCICRKPHNNRFMICCDVCEEWFHGKCVGITKTIGKQMEQDGLEWSCPNCTKKKKVEEHDRETEKIKLLKEKMAQSIKEQQQKVKESQKLKNQALSGKEKSLKSPKSVSNLRQTKISEFSHTPNQGSEEEETVGRKCIMCKGPVRENSIYCSDDCIRKHSQHAISQLMADANKKSGSESSPSGPGENAKLAQKITKEDPRIVVMDSNSKKFLVGQSAPTIANLTTWLKENPSYHVVYKKSDKPGKVLLTSRKVVKIQSKPGESQKVVVQSQKPTDAVKSTQLKLAVSPNSKQINVLQPSLAGGGKKVIQVVNATGRGTKPTTTAYVVKPKQAEVIEALPLALKTVVPKGVPVKAKEVSSPKIAPVASSKDTAAAKPPEKVQRKKRERTVKSTETKMGTAAKQEEGKDKEKEKKDADQQIRDSVKKTLAETLKARVQECKDLEFEEKHIEELAVKIEEKLFKHFENKVDTKYKSKYRSLVFNIKDPKNETLFKKIVDNSISPKELVKLSPEELASQELARWREKENQHQLEIIKKTELELMTKGNTYIMKSHKGEQVIESDQSEKVAAVAAEIDPNTPVQELVSAINSVTSTTQDAKEEEEKNKSSETSLMKMKKKEKEKRRSRDRKHDRRDKDRRRSSSRSSRSRSHRSKDKKRSRSRDRDKERSRSRHKDKKPEKKKEREGKEGGEDVAVEKEEEKSDKYEISTSEDAENKAPAKSVEEDEEDRVPSSTVIIKTPDINVEEPEQKPLWKGTVVMADVAKFSGVAHEVSGDCSGLYIDVPEKVDVVGRIPFSTVWDYIARMKKMGTKDILVIKIVPVTEEEKAAYVTLYSYLSKRSRIGVIGKTSDAVKDFYLYPLASHSPVPQVLLPLDGPPFEVERENIILGIIVRNKHRSRHLGLENTQRYKKVPLVDEEGSHVAETAPDRSYTPPLPDREQEELLKKVRQKRKIRVRMEYKSSSLNEDDEDELKLEDDDSPYSPGDSDDDLPPLPKIQKTSMSAISSSISKLLSPHLTTASDSNLQDPVEIQKKIEEINRAIEEQTQQIQSLTSAVPKLSASGVLPAIPLLTNVTSSILTPSSLSPNSFPVSNPSATVPPNPLPPTLAPPVVPPPPPMEEVQLPLISETDECNSPTRSYTPPIKVEENIPFLPEVTSKISLPSNLQEILNSIQKKTGGEEAEPPGARDMAKPLEELINADNPDVKNALSVLNQTKNLLPGLFDLKDDKPDDGAPPATTTTSTSTSTPLLSRLTDQELLQKAKEMEMEAELMHSMNPCPPQPLPPGVQDIPLLPFTNPPPPPFFSALPEDKKPDKKVKLDPKTVFESEGVPDFNIPGSSWEDKRGAKAKGYKIDIRLGMKAQEKKSIDVNHFDIESISQMEERHGAKGAAGAGAGEGEGERAYGKGEERYRSSAERDRRRSDEREWKYESRRHWEEGGRRYKEEYRRHGRRERGPPPSQKFRFEHRGNRHLQKEWDGSIKSFEERQRWRNQEMRREVMRRSRKRADSSSN